MVAFISLIKAIICLFFESIDPDRIFFTQQDIKGLDGYRKTLDDELNGKGWTFLNKEDKKIYYPALIKTWIAQIIIVLIIFGITVYVQKRRDV